MSSTNTSSTIKTPKNMVIRSDRISIQYVNLRVIRVLLVAMRQIKLYLADVISACSDEGAAPKL